MKALLKIVEPVMLSAVIIVLIVCAVNNVKNSGLLTAIVALTSFVPFVMRFELQRPNPSEIMPIAVLSAIAIVGRIVLTPIMSFQPVTALVIFTGIFFGRQSGYLTGAFTALISNMVMGQGAWTPWQMYTWGMIGFFAGLLAEKGVFGDIGNGKLFEKKSGGKIRVVIILIYGVVASALYSIVLDTWYLITFVSDVTLATVTTVYFAGILMNISHIISTTAILIIVIKPWGKKIERIKIKYGIGPSKIV